MRVFVYWNLHKKCWSIKSMSGETRGRVISHARDWVIDKPEFKVSEAGRQRVIRERRKNVHAGVVGDLRWFSPLVGTADEHEYRSYSGSKVTYNPYKYSTFVDPVTQCKVLTSELAFTNGKEVFYK